MSARPVRITPAVEDVLDILTASSPDDPPWGLRFCELTGRGTSTIYPVLDRLVSAGWIAGWWEDPAPADRPRKRFYEITSAGRELYAAERRARNERRATWLRPARPGAAS